MDYAAPEVRAGAALSAASDVYALGLLLYRLLTGKRPFPVSGGEPTPARRVCPACPRGLEGLLLGMLNPRPDMRPELARILTTLEDEQEDLAAGVAELAEGEASDEPDDERGPPAQAGDRAIEPVSVAVADTVTAGGIFILDMMINAIYGGMGVGFINFFVFVVIAVFISGLMVGRTPELFGKKIEEKEVKIAALVSIAHPFFILVSTAIASHLAA